jgi:hypothetical protein
MLAFPSAWFLEQHPVDRTAAAIVVRTRPL